jgi:hypothetical protein
VALAVFTTDIFSGQTFGLERSNEPELTDTEQQICNALNIDAETFAEQRGRS